MRVQFPADVLEAGHNDALDQALVRRREQPCAEVHETVLHHLQDLTVHEQVHGWADGHLAVAAYHPRRLPGVLGWAPARLVHPLDSAVLGRVADVGLGLRARVLGRVADPNITRTPRELWQLVASVHDARLLRRVAHMRLILGAGALGRVADVRLLLGPRVLRRVADVRRALAPRVLWRVADADLAGRRLVQREGRAQRVHALGPELERAQQRLRGVRAHRLVLAGEDAPRLALVDGDGGDPGGDVQLVPEHARAQLNEVHQHPALLGQPARDAGHLLLPAASGAEHVRHEGKLALHHEHHGHVFGLQGHVPLAARAPDVLEVLRHQAVPELPDLRGSRAEVLHDAPPDVLRLRGGHRRGVPAYRPRDVQPQGADLGVARQAHGGQHGVLLLRAQLQHVQAVGHLGEGVLKLGAQVLQTSFHHVADQRGISVLQEVAAHGHQNVRGLPDDRRVHEEGPRRAHRAGLVGTRRRHIHRRPVVALLQVLGELGVAACHIVLATLAPQGAVLC
mmetsp:Transcript_66187/g.175968  ORF Transcript_66187/g.175968 Transcript_66187/m.175968 type:complete len:509 (-) Transcript_66187:360-1886(-)